MNFRAIQFCDEIKSSDGFKNLTPEVIVNHLINYPPSYMILLCYKALPERFSSYKFSPNAEILSKYWNSSQ